MLQSIYIQNYALIDTLDISFTPGFSGDSKKGQTFLRKFLRTINYAMRMICL